MGTLYALMDVERCVEDAAPSRRCQRVRGGESGLEQFESVWLINFASMQGSCMKNIFSPVRHGSSTKLKIRIDSEWGMGANRPREGVCGRIAAYGTNGLM